MSLASLRLPSAASARNHHAVTPRSRALPGALLGLGIGLVTALFGCGNGEGYGWMPTIDEKPARDPMATVNTDPDCPPDVPCSYYPAAYQISNPVSMAYGNLDVANRPADGLDIRYIVIHTTEIDYATTIRIFQNPANNASAHYLIRSSDGYLVKFISPRHLAWHAGNWYMNMHSIGIEHEAIAAEGPTYFTDAMYTSSARLVRHLAKQYGIPLDRAHIIGHDEVPGITQARQDKMHWDPGPYWDWDRFMQLVQAGSDPVGETADTGAESGVIAIRPRYADNQPHLTYCYGPDEASDCRDAPMRPANFLYLRKMPDDSAPLVDNPFLTRWPGDRMYNWGNKARTGQRYFRIERVGDWDAIYYSGQKAWLKNPGRMSTRSVGQGAGPKAMLITPKAGATAIPVYGVGYPQDAAYLPPTRPQTLEKIYEIPAGQKYVAIQKVRADYYWAKVPAPTPEAGPHVLVRDATEYYQIDFNHRMSLVKASDVEVTTVP